MVVSFNENTRKRDTNRTSMFRKSPLLKIFACRLVTRERAAIKRSGGVNESQHVTSSTRRQSVRLNPRTYRKFNKNRIVL